MLSDTAVLMSATSEISIADLIKPKGVQKWWWGVHIWLFANYQLRRANKECDAYCFTCKKALKYYKSTSNIDDHIKAAHTEKPKDPGPVATRLKGGQTTMPAYMEQSHTFKWQLIRWVVLSLQSLSEVEQNSFGGMVRSLFPGVKIPSRRVLCEDIDMLAESARLRIAELVKHRFCAITTDAWTSLATESYMSLTVHFITDDFRSVNLPVECSPFRGSHTAERIKEKTDDMLAAYGIETTFVSAVVADNAANQVAAGRLADFESLGCGPHTLQLTVKLVLEDSEVAQLLKLCRKIVGAIKHSALKGACSITMIHLMSLICGKAAH